MNRISDDGNIDVHSDDKTVDILKEDFGRLNFQIITEELYIQLRRSNIDDHKILQLERVKMMDIQASKSLQRQEFKYLSDEEYENAVATGTNEADLRKENGRKRRLIERELQRLTFTELPTSFNVKLQLNLVVIGKTGNGKSTTANALLGEKALEQNNRFKEHAGTIPVTTDCEMKFSEMGDITIAIIDTPGLYDTKMPFERSLQAISEIILLSPHGIHAFLFVVNVHARFTEDELKTLREMKLHFGEAFDEHSMLVFTHGNRILEDKKTLKKVCDEIKNNGKEDEKFINAFRNYIVAVENKSSVPAIREKNRQSIISTALLVSQNGSKVYTNELFAVAQAKKKQIRLSNLAELISQMIVQELKNDSQFIYKIDHREVPDQFIESVKEQLSLQGLQYSSDQIRNSTLEVMDREKKVFESVFKATAKLFQKWKRRCVFM